MPACPRGCDLKEPGCRPGQARRIAAVPGGVAGDAEPLGSALNAMPPGTASDPEPPQAARPGAGLIRPAARLRKHEPQEDSRHGRCDVLHAMVFACQRAAGAFPGVW